MRRSLSSLAALALLATPAAAQSKANESVAGPPASAAVLASSATSGKRASSDLRERALLQAAEEIRNDANAGALWKPKARKPIPAGASQAVVAVMSEPGAEDHEQLRNALMMSGRDEGDVESLIGAMQKVLSEPSTGRTRNARKHLDDFMSGAMESYRVNPPAEVAALDVALARLAAADSGFVTSQRNAKEEARAAKAAKRDEQKRAEAARKAGKGDAKGRSAKPDKKSEKARADSIKAEKKRAEKAKADSVKAQKERAEQAKETKARAEKAAREAKERAEKAAKDSAKAATRQPRSQVRIQKYAQPVPGAKP